VRCFQGPGPFNDRDSRKHPFAWLPVPRSRLAPVTPAPPLHAKLAAILNRGFPSMQTTQRSVRLALLLMPAALSGCATRPVAAPAPAPLVAAADENLNAVLWFQTAAEYEALLLQIYADATEALSVALADPDWSAAPEQLQPPAGLRPAVVVDLDETFLDNSAY